MRTAAIIPARGGSKGVPGKNIRSINGRPLIAWSILQALESAAVDDVIVSTDSEEIASIAIETGATVPALRPAHLAEDATPTEPVLMHAVENWTNLSANDAIILLQPTSPLRLAGSIDRAFAAFREQGADSLVSVCERHAFFWKYPRCPEALYNYKNRLRRQDIAPDDRWYRENGSIYITKVSVLMNGINRLGGKIAMHIMTEIESNEIDTEADFQVVEALMRSSGL